MAYCFFGVFSNGPEEAMADLIGAHGGVGRRLAEPFAGFAVAFAADDAYDFPPHRAQSSPLIAWSAAWPSVRFVYLEVQCFGVCDQRGFAFADGALLARVDEFRQAEAPRRELFQAAGLEPGPDVFAPLERRFFKD